MHFLQWKCLDCSNVSFGFGLEGSADNSIVSGDEWLYAMYTESADHNMLCAIIITTSFNDWADELFLWADKSSRHISNNANTWNDSLYWTKPQVSCVVCRQACHYMVCASAIRDMAPPMLMLTELGGWHIAQFGTALSDMWSPSVHWIFVP